MSAPSNRPFQFHLSTALIAMLFMAVVFTAVYYLRFHRYIPCSYCKGQGGPMVYSTVYGVAPQQVSPTCSNCQGTGKITYFGWFFD